jgi:predicted dehydrogenase
LGSVHLDYAQQPPSHLLEVTGTEGVLQCDLTACTTRIYRAETGQWEEVPRPEKWERNDMFLDEMKHFLAVARGEAKPSCSLDDGVRVMKLIGAIQASESSGTAISV